MRALRGMAGWYRRRWQRGSRAMRGCLLVATFSLACLGCSFLVLAGQAVGLVSDYAATRSIDALDEPATVTLALHTPTTTPDPSSTPAPSATPEPSSTTEPSATPAPTRTPRPSATPQPSATAQPEDRAREAFRRAIGNPDAIQLLVVNERVVTLRYLKSDIISQDLALRQINMDLVALTCALRSHSLDAQTYQLITLVETIDAFGNSGQAEGVEMVLEPATYARINCAEQALVNLADVAERYTLGPIFR